MTNYMTKYPRICDLETRAHRRLPPFVGAYLFSGTGKNTAREQSISDFETIRLVPRFMRGRVPTDLTTHYMGTSFAAPFSVAPVGLSSLIWPGSEVALAKAAHDAGYGYALSTVAGASVEQVGPIAKDKGIFQLYAPNDRDIAIDLIRRAKEAGFTKLILTSDVPGPSRREEMRIKGAPIGSRSESKPTMRVLWQSALHPSWSLAVLAQGGKFRFRNMEPYAQPDELSNITKFIGGQLNGSLTWDYLKDLRALWDGPMMLKGPLHYEDCKMALAAGVDGLILSNHGGRQLDCAPSPISQLPQLRKKLGKDVTLAIDSGLRSGLDIARAIALGADFCFLGRAFLMGVAALGTKGASHAGAVLIEELENTMMQLGVKTIEELAEVDSRHLFDH